MRIKNQDDITKIEVRKRIIEEIKQTENQHRKNDAYKRYQCYKDKTSQYVIELLLQQFDQNTVEQMRYSISNLSLVRKIVDKLSRVYSNGVVRKTDNDTDNVKLDVINNVLNLTAALKKTNRFLELQKNVAFYLKPCPTQKGTWTIKPEILQPYLYDVVEDYYDREKAMIYVLSDYKPKGTAANRIEHERVAGKGSVTQLSLVGNAPVASLPNGRDEVIADSPQDQTTADKDTYIFWSDKYHFTCLESGEIIADEQNPNGVNPFGLCPIVSFSIDQDGRFWAEGGQDLIDGGILINALISHINHVGVTQGYGQFYMVGENLPRNIEVGPTKAIIAEYKKDEQAEPKMGFLSANPQLDSLRSLVEMYAALLLTTNNLSTTGISTQLAGGASMASGVALIIDKAESLEDVQDQRQVFIDKEKEIFAVIAAMLKTYGMSLSEPLRDLQLSEAGIKSMSTSFNDPTPIMSESEKLGNLKLRQELGLDSMISLIMKDDPSLTQEQAEQKLKDVLEQRIKEKMLEAEISKGMGLEYDSEDMDENENESGDMPMDQEDDTEDQAAKPADNGTPTVGTTAGSADQNVQQLALNGAQVTALVDMVEKVASGTLPRESALNMIVVAFNVTPQDAEKILGSAGKGFKIETPEPVTPAVNQPMPKVDNESN